MPSVYQGMHNTTNCPNINNKGYMLLLLLSLQWGCVIGTTRTGNRLDQIESADVRWFLGVSVPIPDSIKLVSVMGSPVPNFVVGTKPLRLDRIFIYFLKNSSM